jgi:hypothetical protein
VVIKVCTTEETKVVVRTIEAGTDVVEDPGLVAEDILTNEEEVLAGGLDESPDPDVPKGIPGLKR